MPRWGATEENSWQLFQLRIFYSFATNFFTAAAKLFPRSA